MKIQKEKKNLADFTGSQRNSRVDSTVPVLVVNGQFSSEQAMLEQP